MKAYKLFLPTTLFLFLWSIQTTGQKVEYLLPLDNNFTQINNFSEGLARVTIAYDSVRFINTKGKFAFKATFKEAGNFHSGKAWVMKEIGDKEKYGFINKKGKLVISYRYDEVNDFSDNRAVVRKENTWQIIDKNGKTVLKLEDDLLFKLTEKSVFHNGRLEVVQDGKHGYIDKSGEVVIPIKYDIALHFSNGVALVANEIPYKKKEGEGKLTKLHNNIPDSPKEKQWMIIDTTGEVLYTFKKKETADWETNFSNGLLLFRTDRFTFGFMNKYGKRVVEPMEMDQKPFPYSNGVFIEQVSGQRSDNKDGYMVVRDTTGKIISKIPFCSEYGCMVDSNHKFHEGLLAVKIQTENGGALWGYINKQGKMRIPPQYDLAFDFHNGRAVVKMPNGKVNYIINPLKGD